MRTRRLDFSSPGIQRTPLIENGDYGLRAHIVDCPPTIFAMLGLPAPDDMEGRVITELFEKPPDVQTVTASREAAAPQLKEVYSEEELQKVTERLTDLGCME